MFALDDSAVAIRVEAEDLDVIDADADRLQPSYGRAAALAVAPPTCLDRLDLHFELREVVHEYRVLRRVLFRRILAMGCDSGNLDDVAAMDDAIDRAVAEAVDHLLDLTRGRLGAGIPISPRQTHFPAVARGVLDEMRALHPERQIELECHGNLDGRWDSDRLAQVIGNLVTNALVHGDARSPVRLELRDEDGEVRVRVHNRGTPIPPDELPHVFDAFRRARAESEDGLGLGLFIASEIVHAHGGRITATSTEEEGTTFEVTLPCQPPTS